VTEAGIDTAYGMSQLVNLWGMTMQEIPYFGDKLEEGGNDYPVKAVGIDSIAVKSWEETALALEAIIEVS
jgi:hypothetical protein